MLAETYSLIDADNRTRPISVNTPTITPTITPTTTPVVGTPTPGMSIQAFELGVVTNKGGGVSPDIPAEVDALVDSTVLYNETFTKCVVVLRVPNKNKGKPALVSWVGKLKVLKPSEANTIEAVYPGYKELLLMQAKIK